MKALGLPRFNSLLEIEELKSFYDASATNIIFNIINHSEINKIAVPAFICEEIHLTFLSSNKVIKYYEIDKNMQPILNDEHFDCDCLFLCEYFGLPIIDNKNLTKFIKNLKKTIIFDRCHSLFSGTKNIDNNNYLFRENIFFIYSLRKFLPLINGGIMFCHPASNSIPIKNLISGKTTKIKSSYSLNLKRLFRKYSFFNYFLKKRLEINLLKKENLLGYKIQKPFLATSNFKYLNYFTGSIDKNIFKFTNSTFLKKIEVNRCKTLEMINEYFINNNNFRIYENKNFKNDYGIPYGILIDIDKVESKNKIEEELLKPLINQIKNVDVILWPYNAMEKFEISGIELKSKLLILPRI